MPFEEEKIKYDVPDDKYDRDLEIIRNKEKARVARRKRIMAGKFMADYTRKYFSYNGGFLHKHVTKAGMRDTYTEQVARERLNENLLKCAKNPEDARVTRGKLMAILKEIETNRLRQYVDKRGVKKKIICLIGAGGVGKTLAAMHMKHKFGVNVIIPFTDRKPKDYEIEGLDYHFIDISPPPSDVLTLSRKSGLVYALKSSVTDDVNIIMIDNAMFRIIEDAYPDEYELYSVLIRRDIRLRRIVSVENDQSFKSANGYPLTFYNYTIENNGTKRELFNNIERIYNEIKSRENYDEGKERPCDGHSV
jgi:hypothetical protein